jgi:hypothetical protein
MIDSNAWLAQQLKRMTAGIERGKTRRRSVKSVRRMKVTDKQLRLAAKARGWKVAEIGRDFLFAPGDYTIRPL